ncbi:MAG: PspC domain-containing protein [Candidatus Promineifilaceae bacterium]|nr:PspC domain-containing protein [Candidatus Promineifilaceae bacterium]
MQARLLRSEEDRVIAGVCGGLAEYLGVDAVLVRLAFLLLIPAGGLGLPLYLILAIVMPSESDVQSISGDLSEGKPVEGLARDPASDARRHPNGPAIAAALLILLGFYFLFENLGWIDGSLIWPLALILLGIFLLVRRDES